MVVRKILEKSLPVGQTSVTFTDSDIPNSLIRVYSSDSNLFPIDRTLAGTTLTINYEAQDSIKYIALEIVKQGLDIIDNVTSTDTDAALSANQGKVLKDLIDAIVVPTEFNADDIIYDNSITGMSADNVQEAIDEVFTSVSDGKELIADAITDKGVSTSADDTFLTMANNILAIPTGGSIGSLFKKITGQIQNNDSATASYNVGVAMPYTPITKDNVFLDLKSCYFTGNAVYTSSVVINSVNQSGETVNIGWGVQSGTSWQRFHLYYLEDLTRLRVLKDWTTYDNSNKTITIELTGDARNLNADDFIVDFKEVVTGSGASGTYTISKSIENNILTIVLPLSTSRTMKARILYAI